MVNKIMVWGDSILKGIVYDEKKERYAPLKKESCVWLTANELGIDLDNHAHFGMTSEIGRINIERSLQGAAGFAASIIGFGGNDIDYNWKEIAEFPCVPHLPKTPPERFEQNMESIVAMHEKAGIQPILLTLPPISAKRYFDWITREINGENVLKWLGYVEKIFESHLSYDRIVRAVANRLGCMIIDVRKAIEDAVNPEALICIDGIHPNETGHKLMKNAMVAAMASM